MGVMDRIGTSDFRRVRTVAINQSPFSGKVYRSALDDWRWTFTFTYQLQTRAQAAPLLALIAAQAEGAGQMVDVFDPDYGAPLSGYTGNGAINGAGQTGSSIVTDGWAASRLLAKANDKLSILYTGIGSQLFTVLTDVTSNGSGQATFPLDAPLRGSPPDNSVVYLNFATVSGNTPAFRLTGYTKTSEPGGLFSITLSGEEIV